MNELQDLFPLEKIPTDIDVLDGLRTYHHTHTGKQLEEALNNIWPFSFTITSVKTLNDILDYFSDQQRKEYIDSIRGDLPVCTSRDWRNFLSHCSQAQCRDFLPKLSPMSCSDLYDEKNGFFVMLVCQAQLFSLENLEEILSYIHLHFPLIVPSNFELSLLRYTGDADQHVIEKIRLFLKHIQPDLARLTLSVEKLVKCFSINLGMIYDNKSLWTAIVKTYFIGLASKLPYIFYSPEQVQKLYQQLSKDSERTDYKSSALVRFSPELMQNQFEEPIQECLTHLPNVYPFISKYKNNADSFISLLVQYGVENPAILDPDIYPIEHEFHQFIHQVITTPHTSYSYVANFVFKSTEDQLVDDLSNLSPYWLTILNAHIDSLKWNPRLSVKDTHALFRAYINSVKSPIVAATSQPKHNHVFFLKTLAALALSAALVGIGLLMLFSALPTSLGAIVMVSGAVLGFFSYRSRSEQENTNDQIQGKSMCDPTLAP